MVAAGTPMCAKHLAAVARTLQWADECADRGDLLDAIAWLGTLEAIGDEVPGVYAVRRDSWSARAGADESEGRRGSAGAARGVKRCSRRGARRRRWIRRQRCHSRGCCLVLWECRESSIKESMMRVFVAGATGAIGRQLVPRLVAAGHEVQGMTRSESKQAMLVRAGRCAGGRGRALIPIRSRRPWGGRGRT